MVKVKVTGAKNAVSLFQLRVVSLRLEDHLVAILYDVACTSFLFTSRDK